MLSREDHERNHCKKREIACDVCKMPVKAEDIGRHLRNVCPLRIVKCSVSCGCSFMAKEVEYHEKEECVRPCKWNCGESIGPLEVRKLHELQICRKRLCECRYGCEMKGLTPEYLEEHEKFQCAKAFTRCSNGCGRKLPRGDLVVHMDPWRGDCPERLVRCPSNLVGWKIKVVDPKFVRGDDEANYCGLVLQYRRDAWPTGTAPVGSYADDGIDRICVRFPKQQTWLTIKET